jgi:hypothetical protein
MSGDFDAAETWLLQAIAKFETFEISTPLTLPEINLAMVHRHRGRLDEARMLCQAARHHAGAHAGLLSGAEGFAGRVELAAGAIDEAQRSFVNCLALAQQGESKVMIAIAVEGLASIAAHRGNDRLSATLFGFADAYRHSFGSIVPPSERPEYDRTLARLRDRLGDDYNNSVERGRAFSLAEIDKVLVRL